MKLFTAIFSLAILCSSAINAQEYTAGIRTGGGYLIRQKNNPYLVHNFSSPYSWEKEIFIRRESKKHWAFEFSVAHSSSGSNTSIYSFPTCGVSEGGGPEGPAYGRIHINSYATNLSVQYRIVCSDFRTNPLLPRFKSYAGIRLSPTWLNISGDYHFDPTLSVNNPACAYQAQDQVCILWGAVTHTLDYEVSRHIRFSSVAAFNFAANYLTGDTAWPIEQPRAKISLLLGAAYRF